MTLAELYESGIKTLEAAEIEGAASDAFYLLEYVSGYDRGAYLMNKQKPVSEDAALRYERLIKKRAEHIPYQYLTGRAPFMGFSFEVNENVLIPRLDTEILCEQALKAAPEGGRILDLCTGSGCIGISLKKLRPDLNVTCSDISESALSVAEKNAALNGLAAGEGADQNARIRFEKGDLFEPFKDEKFDLIVSNPPYITGPEYETLMPEVRDHEPALALKAGADGLDIYRRLISEAPAHLMEGGYLLLEIGCSQADAAAALMTEAGFNDIEVIKDLAQLDRVVQGQI